MSHPISVCIENTGAKRPAGRFTRCVAVPGSGPGLALDARGCVVWRSEEAPVCRLCVSLDGCLVLLRPEGAPKVTIRRAGRSLEAPVGKPVVLLDGNEIDVASRELREFMTRPGSDRHGTSTSRVSPSGGRTRRRSSSSSCDRPCS